MRKHFLLLFLMALLPLAGWAQDYVEVTITPFDQSVTWNGEKPEVTKAWFQSPGATNPALKDAIATLLEIQDLEGEYDVDEYTYKLKLKNPANNTVYQYEGGPSTIETTALGDLQKVYTIYTSSATATLNITKATAVISTNDLAYVGDALVYTGLAQDLLTIGDGVSAQAATATANGVPVPVVYALSETAETWVSDYATLTGTNAGTYQVYCKVVGTDNYEGALQSLGEKPIAKAVVAANVEEAGGTLGLVYDGNPIALLKTVGTNPAFNFGESTLEYKVWTGDTEPTDWTATTTTTGIAAVTAKNAGAYKVKLKVPATDNYFSGNELAPDAIFGEYHVIIDRALVDETSVSAALVSDETLVFKGAAWEPELAVSYAGSTLTANNGDISIAYADNTNAGTATATVTFNNYYLDNPVVAYTKGVEFTIAQKSLADATITAVVKNAYRNREYKGSAWTMKYKAYVTVTDGENEVDGTNFDLSYENNLNVGSMEDPDETKRPTVIFTGKGNYTGTTKAYFNINPKPLNGANITIDDALETAQTYTSSQITPSTEGMITFTTPDPDYTLLENTDYTVVYGENVSGTGTITITGTGNFDGSVVKEFVIGNATAYIVPVAKSKLYGAADPTLAWKVVDVDNNELGNDVLNGTVTLARQDGEDVGSYLIYVKSYEADAENADNYTLANVFDNVNSADPKNKTAPFTIFANTENTLVLKFKDNLDDAKKTKVYDGTTDVTFTAEDFEAVSGLLNGDEWATIGAGATIAAVLSSADVADGITATATITGLANYPTVEVQAPLAFTITPREITITAKDQIIAQGGALDQSEYVVSDDVTAYGDTNDDLNIELSTTKTAVGGPYADAITVSATNANYDFSYVPGALTITGAAELVMRSVYTDADDDEFTKIKAYDTQTLPVKIIVNRTQTLPSTSTTYTWKGEDWNAFILPFDITPKELSEAFGYAIVNVVNPAATKDGNIAFKLQMSGTIAANTPFMLKNYQAVPENTVIDFGTREIVAPASEEVSVDAGENINFIGSYKTKKLGENMSNLYFYNGEGAWKHLKAATTTSWNIAPFNAYMEMPATGGAREYTFTFEELDGGTTAIRSISEDATGTNAKGWYNLNGMKMDGAPVQKGVYIKDGKKVVIK